MTTKRFNNLAMLSTHKTLTDAINFLIFGNEFASKNDLIKRNLGSVPVICSYTCIFTRIYLSLINPLSPNDELTPIS